MRRRDVALQSGTPHSKCRIKDHYEAPITFGFAIPPTVSQAVLPIVATSVERVADPVDGIPLESSKSIASSNVIYLSICNP